jgi:hypothetical protein
MYTPSRFPTQSRALVYAARGSGSGYGSGSQS